MSKSEPLNRYGQAIRQRYQIGADGTLTEIERDPDMGRTVLPAHDVGTDAKKPESLTLAAIQRSFDRVSAMPDTPVFHWATSMSPITWSNTETQRAALPKATLAGPIVAWRAWRYSKGGRLMSYTYTTASWPEGQPLKSAVLPSAGTTHGIYAMKTRDDLDPLEVDDRRALKVIVGTVAIWGTVIEHVKGYRAEYAYPVMLDLRVPEPPPPMPGFPMVRRQNQRHEQVAALLRQRYGCQVLV